MDGSRYALKVGLFAALTLLVLGGLIAILSKGANPFASTYEIHLRAASVGGLKKGAVVQLAGVTVGTVAGADLAPDGRSVLIRLKIDGKYRIHADARFVIEQVGLLGDQYVAIYPTANAAPLLQPGATVAVEQPLNFQDVARSATELLPQLGETIKLVNGILGRVDRGLLTENSVSNANVTVGNFRTLSERLLTTVDGINRLVASNSEPIFVSVSNLVRFSAELDQLSAEMTQTVASNRTELTAAVRSLDTTARTLERLAYAVEEGQGVAGALIKDQQLKASLVHIVQNLDTVSSNIAKYGLLYKPRHPNTNVVPPPKYSPKSPFEER